MIALDIHHQDDFEDLLTDNITRLLAIRVSSQPLFNYLQTVGLQEVFLHKNLSKMLFTFSSADDISFRYFSFAKAGPSFSLL